MLDHEHRYRGNRKLRAVDYVAIYQSPKKCEEVMADFDISKNTVYAVRSRRLENWATHDLPDRTIDRRRRD